MTSVWKRLQRVGKKASKFQFTASYQSLTVECVRGGKWQPNKLVVVWTRRKRRKLTKPMSWQPGISNPFRGIIVWPEPDPVDITVTLYKLQLAGGPEIKKKIPGDDSKPDSPFEDKEWTFVIEDESVTGRRKPIATGAINMVDYVSVESRTFDVTLTMKVASKKLVSASLEFNLTCVLIKEGMATDDDMISIGSMMSLGEGYYLDDNDDDMEVPPSPRIRHKRNLSHGNAKVPVTKAQEAEDRRSVTPTASPLLAKKRSRIRSKSALGDNTKTLISDIQKEEGMKRLSTGSDISAEISDGSQDSSKDKNKMESELIKWARSCTKGYRGVKVKDMTTSWRDGLAFCAILHHFHPDKIDFTSLDPHNIKDNNKLAFTAFEKLGIPRLLDPTQMMFSPVPDKLSVMTYVYQIKTHFNRKLPPSPLSLLSSNAPRRLPPVPSQVSVTAANEEPIDQDDGRVADINGSVSTKEPTAKGSDEGYNPFLDEEEENEVDSTTPEVTADSSASSLGDSNERKRSSEQEAVTKSSSASEEDKNSIQESESKRNDVLVKSNVKPPLKPPRLHEITNSSPSVVDTTSKTSETANKKDKNESKAYNPFDEDDNDDAEVSKKNDPSSKSAKPNKGYNPFDDEEDDVADDDSQEKNINDNEPKQGYNPFDDDNDTEDVSQTKSVVDQNAAKKSSGVVKRRVSYPHDFNPFEDDDDLQSGETEKSSQNTKYKDGKVDKKASATKSYNPFDDDNVDEGTSDDVSAMDTSQGEILTRKSSAESKGKVNKAAESGAASGLAKPTETHKKRRAPPPPAVRSSDDPWTARLPDDATPRRRRATKPTTPGTGEQISPQTSPAKRGPKRAAPAPPRRPPLIPTFDEWRSGASTDRGAAGDNDRPAASSSGESSPSRKISPNTGDTSQKSDSGSGSGSQSPVTAKKGASTDGGNQADIKQLARQVLMDARKKAGASGALPRERVAEIAKTSKGPTADKETTGSIQGETDVQEKKVDDQEAMKKKENLRLRKEELQRRKKAAEKAHIMVQNAIAKEKAQKVTASPEQTRTERKTQVDASGVSSPDAASGDQKPVGNKNLQHRPLKLKDKENDLQKRKLSAGKDAKSPPDKGGFKESEELQRIRQILNQGKEKKPSTSENVDQETDTVQAQSTGTSQEDKRKMSDSKSSKYTAVNGVTGSPSPTRPPRPKARGPNARLHDYVESRKMNFEVFEVPPIQPKQNDEQDNAQTEKDDLTDGQTKDEDSTLDGEDQDSEDQTLEFQDTSEYVRQELKSLEEQQEALDKVGEKLEIELRRAMECKGCEEEQEKLMQDWFLLVNKKNELVRRQGELNLLKNEEELERNYDMLQRELRTLLEMEEGQKTEEQREREVELMEQLVSVVNKRDELVQFEDSQLQQAERDALHVQKVIDNVRIPKDRNDCVLQ